MTTPTWRTSSYSNNGTCVAIAHLDTSIAIRNSQHPDRGTITFSVEEIRAFVAACTAGELDDLT